MSIILHGDPKVIKNGGRNIAPMSEEEFLEKIKLFLGDYNSYRASDEIEQLFCAITDGTKLTDKIYSDFKGFVYTGSYETKNFNGETITKTVKNELHFDLENADISLEEYDGCPYVFVSMCGGDWQWPFCFMIYHDGKTFRVFVPTYGNNWIPFVKNGVKCKGLIGTYDGDDGYEYEGEPDWKMILKAMGNRYTEDIIAGGVHRALNEPNNKCSEVFIDRYGFDKYELFNFDNFESYCEDKVENFLEVLKKKGDVENLNLIDSYILKMLKEAIFSILDENLEDTDTDNCIEEFESRVEPIEE